MGTSELVERMCVGPGTANDKMTESDKIIEKGKKLKVTASLIGGKIETKNRCPRWTNDIETQSQQKQERQRKEG